MHLSKISLLTYPAYIQTHMQTTIHFIVQCIHTHIHAYIHTYIHTSKPLPYRNVILSMNHDDHGFCVGFMAACLAIPFGLSMENNDSRLLCIPKEEFQRVRATPTYTYIHTYIILSNCMHPSYQVIQP